MDGRTDKNNLQRLPLPVFNSNNGNVELMVIYLQLSVKIIQLCVGEGVK